MFSDQEFQEVMQRIKANNEQKKELITSNKELHQLKKNIKNQIENIAEKIKQVNAKMYLNKTWKEDKLVIIYRRKIDEYNKLKAESETDELKKELIPL